MQLIHALAAGIVGAENGTAEIYDRGGSSRISYYLGDGGFEGSNQKTAGTDVDLDEYGSAVVYVTQYALVIVKDSAGLTVRTFTVGNYDGALEVISPSFTGTAYATGASGANKPLTLEQALDALITSFGAKDFNVLYEGSEVALQSIITSLGGYLLSVKNYGAEGDGTTDDTAAITACIAAADTAGKVVFFPKGVYRIASAFTLLADVSILGCGPSKSIIRMDHASNAFMSFSDTPTDVQTIRGLAFDVAQAHTGPILSLTTAAQIQFEDCSFGDVQMTAAANVGYFNIGASSISPKLSFFRCNFTFADNWAGSFFADGAFTATPTVNILRCRFTFAGEVSGNPVFMGAGTISCIGSFFDLSAMTANWTSGIFGNASASLVCVGNSVSDTNGAEVSFIHGSITSVYESANLLGSGVILLYSNIPDEAFMSTSRGGKVGVLSQSGGGTINLASEDYAQGILSNQTVVLTVTDANNFTLAATVVEGLEFDVFIVNNAGGAIGTITYSGTSFAGGSAISGTGFPTTIAAVGTFISIRFRGITGPDGLLYYQVGSAYAGT